MPSLSFKSALLSVSLLFGLTLFGLIQPVQAAGQFYATQELQSQYPQAFALQPEAQAFVLAAQSKTVADANRLVELILADKSLVKALADWQQLSIDEQIPHLRKIFALEYRSMGIKQPTLIIDNHSYPTKMVYFDFDVSHFAPLPSSSINNVSRGTVYLNPEKLATQDKFASLAFLIHETRHSYQFQLSQQANTSANDAIFAAGYRAAFNAQKSLTGFGFSDFLTLLNEYEAFQYGNYVLGQLTHWTLDLTGMGTFASQFDQHGQLKIDLATLMPPAKSNANTDELSLLEQYNLAAKVQYQLREADARAQ
ncbi:hypothetical protein L2729_08360 [Shewanella gelidimarina]|uniref:hypothetical protein n=1 Tax=Shewanella gelidimarina TaxID=56813 RepID=UPI00200FBD47|nr:hypothetical protein [Shewanella gelidimarina]MCL1058014.1 hypothetical protein [Shewanella gelidimarina]